MVFFGDYVLNFNALWARFPVYLRYPGCAVKLLQKRFELGVRQFGIRRFFINVKPQGYPLVSACIPEQRKIDNPQTEKCNGRYMRLIGEQTLKKRRVQNVTLPALFASVWKVNVD